MCCIHLLDLSTPNIIQGLGLFLDIIGVIMLYKYVSKPLEEIPENTSNYDSAVKATFGGSDEFEATPDVLDELSANLASEINNSIRNQNKENKKIKSKSLFWLCVVVLGFVCQIIGNFLI